MKLKIAVLPGDGVGPEVTREAVRVLKEVGQFTFVEKPIGAAAYREHGVVLPEDTLRTCLESNAVLLGAVGSPELDHLPPAERPEAALLQLRRELGGFANLRPAFCHDALADCTPLKPEVVKGTDVLIVRELLGGLYFGEPRGFWRAEATPPLSDSCEWESGGVASALQAFNTMRYSVAEIERVARVAFAAARTRRRKVTSVDKANVLETSRLWREVVTRVAAEYPDIELDHVYVDACATLLLTDPKRFDVILTENLFGDILSDEAAAFAGSLGMLPSATIGGAVDLYEPVHGSAPTLAGRNLANPIGAIASAALLLRYTAKLEEEARAVEDAIARVVAQHHTPDLGGTATTTEVGDAVVAHVIPSVERGMTDSSTLFDKLWDAHVVHQPADGPPLLYIDLHLVHEVTSPQAFDGLREAGRKVRRPERTIATVDHNVPTHGSRGREARARGIEDPLAAEQIAALRANCAEFGIELHDIDSSRQGIVHVIGPELGLTRPGMTIVCGDSHTSTHGAFGALAFGIGTSEVEHVLATQCLWWPKPKAMRIDVAGALPVGVTAKDLALAIIAAIGTNGATGHVIEYTGEAVRALSMEGRMTLCNMSIEAGARAGMVAPDETTFAYLRERGVPILDEWRSLASDEGARFDKIVRVDARTIAPQVTWGTTPAMAAPVTDAVPAPNDPSMVRALEYMALEPGTPLQMIALDRVFIGSCTNARIEDLRAAARVARGYRVASSVKAMVVPGSQTVKRAAEEEGLDRIFRDAGFEWREPGCSMCLGMNADVLAPGERCASTSNRNFEGRQGRGGRTHLVSPAMAAAAAITGRFTDVRRWEFR